MENTILKRSCNVYRPYFVNGKRIESIIIYKNGEIILKTRSGWLEDMNDDLSSKYNSDLKEITINGETKRANKENLNRKDNYLLKGCRDYSFEDGYIIYIHADNIFKSYEYIQKDGDTKYTRGYFLYGYKVELLHDATIEESYLKHYNAGDTIEPCDRGKHLYPGHKKDQNGKMIKDENGSYIEDGTFHCLRFKNVNKKNFIFYNGLYIKEGK